MQDSLILWFSGRLPSPGKSATYQIFNGQKWVVVEATYIGEHFVEWAEVGRTTFQVTLKVEGKTYDLMLDEFGFPVFPLPKMAGGAHAGLPFFASQVKNDFKRIAQ